MDGMREGVEGLGLEEIRVLAVRNNENVLISRMSGVGL